MDAFFQEILRLFCGSYPFPRGGQKEVKRFSFFSVFNTLKDWTQTIVYVGVFYLVCTTLFVEGYQIPSGSMEPTFHGDPGFLQGDRIFALKGISQFLPFERGDIVIFISVEDQETFIVKRLVGLPGDTVQIKDERIYVNGKPLEDPPIFKKNSYYLPDFREDSRGEWWYLPTYVRDYEGKRHGLPPIMKIKTQYSENSTGKAFRCFAQTPYVVPKDSYFVLGDNSASSNDGRYWGFVPKSHLLGKASLIWWPLHRSRVIRP